MSRKTEHIRSRDQTFFFASDSSPDKKHKSRSLVRDFFLKEIRTIRALPLAGALLVIFLCTATSWAMRTENPGSLGCAGYIQMYLEQAVRRIVNVGDLSTFDRVPRRCAGRKGQILTMTETVRNAGVSVPSIKKRVGILQARYQIHLLPPHSANLGKHIVESPKLDFLTR